MLERKGSVLRRCITEVTVLAQVQLSGCLLCLLGRNQGCCGCRAGQVVEYVVRVGRFEGFENECRLAAAFGDGFASGIACPDVVAGAPEERNGSVFGSAETGAGAPAGESGQYDLRISVRSRGDRFLRPHLSCILRMRAGMRTICISSFSSVISFLSVSSTLPIRSIRRLRRRGFHRWRVPEPWL